jgi:low affinity Fe/Cu permease
MTEFFAKAAKWVSAAVGSPFAFVTAAAAVAVWAISGPLFGYSQNWQLVINTGTTIITFLMVFVIQNAQNRDQKAIQIKLDELLRATGEARTGFANLENLDDATLAKLEHRFQNIHEMNAADVDEAIAEERQDEQAERQAP